MLRMWRSSVQILAKSKTHKRMVNTRSSGKPLADSIPDPDRPSKQNTDTAAADLNIPIPATSSDIERGNPICKFITTAYFLGKPISEAEVSRRKEEKANQILTGYQEWIERTKKAWAKEKGISESTYEERVHSGEDWWFIHESNEETFLGVADGVGSWKDDGVDPSQVAQGLMYHSDQALNLWEKNKKDSAEGVLNPKSLLNEAYSKMLQDNLIQGGSSTALIAKLDAKKSSVEWANLGDSSLILVRPKDKLIETLSKSQQHCFNFPYQLTKYPLNYKPHPGEPKPDSPDSAHYGLSSLQDGDVIILCTDGLADNLWPQEILDKVLRICRFEDKYTDGLFHVLAPELCDLAFFQSRRHDRDFPYAKAAREHGRNRREGRYAGKLDDITVTVSLVRHIKP